MKSILILLAVLVSSFGSAAAGTNLLVNGGAESADLTGWSYTIPWSVFGSTADFSAFEGRYFFAPLGGPMESSMHQDIDLTSFQSCIDQGACVYTYSGATQTPTWFDFHHNVVPPDSARTRPSFLGGPTEYSWDSGYSGTAGPWAPFSVSGALLPGTRSVRVELDGKVNTHRSNFEYIDALFDGLSFSVEPTTPARQATWGELKSTYR